MKYFITIVFTLISFTTNIFSQTTPSIQWQKTLGGSGFDAAYSIQQTRDGGYIIAGYTESNDGNVTGNHGGSDYWIVKLDSNENIIWQKTLGGSDDDRAYSIQQTKDGGYVVAGYSSSNDGDVKSENQAYCWIVKLDQNGNIIWQNKIGDLIYGQSIKQTTDGGYIIVGDSPTNDFGIVKLDSNGNVSWQKSFGGKSRGAAYSVQQTTDGGYVVAGYTYSNDISFTNNQGSADYWIVKLDASGNMIWQKTFGGADSEHAYNIQQTADGGYIVAGETWSADGNDFHRIINYWIIKLDINGNIIWQKTLGGSGYDEAYSIKQTRDGGYIIAGYTGSNELSGFDRGYVYLIVKLDAKGNLVWRKTLGGSSNDFAQSIQQTKDGNYIIAGYTDSRDGDVTGNHGNFDYWIVKLNDVEDACSPVTPTVTVVATPNTNVYEGTKVSFTATVTNGGTLPVYQWKKNGITVGTNSKTYTDSVLKTGDSVYCVLTSNASCITTTSVKSNMLKMTVRASVTPAVSIAVSPGTTVCKGSKVTFTATATNGGTSPVYQWKKNGANVGTNSSTYVVDTALKNSDSIYCILTSKTAHATTVAKSNGIKMTVNTPTVPTVNTTASTGTTVDANRKVIFTATAINGGSTPVYHWRKNGRSVGTNSKTYTDSVFKTGDSIYCELTSDVSCVTTSIVKSNMLKMTVSNPVIPTVSIAVSPGTSVCKGSKVTFKATVTNSGTSPVFQWKKNGINVGTNSRTYVVDTALKNSDSIYCLLTSKSAHTSTVAKSNGIKMTVNNPATPIVSITVNPGTSICKGTIVTFTATASKSGTTPVYQWKKNGITVGTNSKTYTADATLKNGDNIYCVVTSNAGCATTPTAKSNVIKMTVNNLTVPTVSITASTGTTVCTNSKVRFTATAINEGAAPIYQWKKNGINVGTNSKTYIDNGLKTGDSIYCVLASTACITTSIVNSNGLKMVVNNCLQLPADNTHQSSSIIKQQPSGLLLTAAPNPFESSFQLIVKSPVSTKAEILITSITGQRVFKKDVSLNQGTNTIPVIGSTWSAGTYYVQVGTGSEIKSYKIIKK